MQVCGAVGPVRNDLSPASELRSCTVEVPPAYVHAHAHAARFRNQRTYHTKGLAFILNFGMQNALRAIEDKGHAVAALKRAHP
jgi:hypothetical protein